MLFVLLNKLPRLFQLAFLRLNGIFHSRADKLAFVVMYGFQKLVKFGNYNRPQNFRPNKMRGTLVLVFGVTAALQMLLLARQACGATQVHFRTAVRTVYNTRKWIDLAAFLDFPLVFPKLLHQIKVVL